MFLDFQEELIFAKMIRVNNVIAGHPGAMIDPDKDVVLIDGKKVKEEIRKNGSVDRSFLQKEFTMSVVHAARLMKILEGDTRFMKVRG